MNFIASFFGSEKTKLDFKNFVGIYNDKLIFKDTKGRYYVTSGKKHYLKKGTRVSKTKLEQSPKRNSPKRNSPKRNSPKRKERPKYKTVKLNNKELGKRLSARHVYDTKGKKALGKKFKILQPDGTVKTKVLRLRKNGSPYFATKFGQNNEDNYPTIPPIGVLQPQKIELIPFENAHYHKNNKGKVMCFGS